MNLKRKITDDSFVLSNKHICIDTHMFDHNTKLECIKNIQDNESQLVFTNSLNIRNIFLHAFNKYQSYNMKIWSDDDHSTFDYQNNYRLFLERNDRSILVETKVIAINQNIIISGMLEFYDNTDRKINNISLSAMSPDYCIEFINTYINSFLN